MGRYLIFTAVWEAVQYSISLNPGEGGINVEDVVYTVESEIMLPVPNDRNGYTFAGWYSGENGSGTQFSDSTGVLLVPIESITSYTCLYAKWNLKYYTITYVLNGGTNNSDNPSSYTIETGITTLKSPTRNNYRFAGWYTTSGFSALSAVASIGGGGTGDIVLYAKWIQLYPIQFSRSTGETLIYSAIGDVITLPPIQPGYIYVYGGQRYESGTNITVVGSMVFDSDDKTLAELYDSSANRYPIYTANQLVAIGDASHDTTGNTYVLMNNITTSLQNARHIETFYGTLDGDGYTIKNIRVDLNSNDTGGKNCGLVRINRGIIKNLVIDSRIIDIAEPTSYNSTWVYAGFVAGKNYGTIYNVTVKNCELISSRHTVAMGGIAGINIGGTISNCSVENLTFTGCSDMGGIVGSSNGGTITSCHVSGVDFNIEVDGENRSTGGVVGYAKNGTLVSSCHVESCTIAVESYSLANDVVQPCIGTVIGHLDASTMKSCTARSCSIDSSVLPDPTYVLFVKTHDPELYVGSFADGKCGSNNGGTIS